MSGTVVTLKMLLLGEDQSASKAVHGVGEAVDKAAKRTALLGKATSLGMGAVAAAGAAAFTSAWSQHANAGQLQAKLGLSPEDARAMAKTSGRVYAANFGESLDEVNDAVATVKQGLAGMVKDNEIEGLTEQSLAFKQTFGVETADSIKAVSQMLKTGLAKNAQEAFDILTTGEQTGADKAGDLMDTFNEYGTQFRKLGIDGPAALGLINQGLQNGARDSDLVADAIKEFSIRAVDGSTTSAAGFKALGLDAHRMTSLISKGGAGANAGLQAVLSGLRNVKDPARQAQIATSLFGTQAEDLGKALFSLDPATATAGRGMDKLHGSTAAMVAASSSASNPLDNLKRSLMGTAASIGGYLIPVMVPASDLISKLGPVLLIGAAAFVAISLAMKAMAIIQALVNVLTGEAAAETTLQTIALGAQRAATLAASGAQWLLNAALNANPIGLVILLIVALIAAFVLAYAKVGWFRAGVNAAFRSVLAVVSGTVQWVRTHWPLLLAILTGPFGLAVLYIARNWAAIKSGATSAVGWVKGKLDGLVTFFAGMPGRIAGAASGMFHGVTDAFRWAINGIIAGWNSLHFSISIPSVHIPGTNQNIGGGSIGFGVPGIPFLAKGGIATRPTLAMIGEGAEDEAVLPLSRLRALMGGGPGGGGGPSLSITGGTFLGSKREIGQWIAAALREYKLAGGVMP